MLTIEKSRISLFECGLNNPVFLKRKLMSNMTSCKNLLPKLMLVCGWTSDKSKNDGS